MISYYWLGLFFLASPALGQDSWHATNCAGDRTAIVHLFEWKWTDIEQECVRFLGPRGYCGVQVSPPNEHAQITAGADRPWWERYQPVSYRLESRSGSREQFISMVETCNNNNVRIYVDAVINHMGNSNSQEAPGSGGSDYDGETGSYPAVPYTMEDFNTCDKCPACCCVEDELNHEEVRDCRLFGLMDLDLKKTHTQNMVVGYLNDLIDIGVAGFRVDAGKYMWPDDLEAVFNRLNNLNPRWFGANAKPFAMVEVLDMSREGWVNVHEYSHLGQITEFRYCVKISQIADYPPAIKVVWDQVWGMLDPQNAFVFVDNHDNQRGHGAGGEAVTFKNPPKYKMAQALTLAWAHGPRGGGEENGYGSPRVMSSYDFDEGEDSKGPPSDEQGNTDDVPINADGSCGGGWVCEHRWPAIAGMAGWAKASQGAPVENEFEDGQIFAFSRGARAFVVFNNPSRELQTGLPAGDYCNVIEGCATSSGCEGQTVTVNGDGTASINIEGNDPILAIHIEAMAGSNQCVGSD